MSRLSHLLLLRLSETTYNFIQCYADNPHNFWRSRTKIETTPATKEEDIQTLLDQGYLTGDVCFVYRDDDTIGFYNVGTGDGTPFYDQYDAKTELLRLVMEECLC